LRDDGALSPRRNRKVRLIHRSALGRRGLLEQSRAHGKIQARADCDLLLTESGGGSHGLSGHARSGRVPSPRSTGYPVSSFVSGLPWPTRRRKWSRCFQLIHVRLIVAQIFPRPNIMSRLRREALQHAVIILDDLRLLLHIEIAQRTR
jgi:hypothetical protein